MGKIISFQDILLLVVSSSQKIYVTNNWSRANLVELKLYTAKCSRHKEHYERERTAVYMSELVLKHDFVCRPDSRAAN